MLTQGFDVRLAWWEPKVPDPEWSVHLRSLPAATRGDGYQRITRADLLETGASSRPTPGVLLSGLAWGTGTWAFLVGRRARVFTHNDPLAVDRALTGAAQLLTERSPEAAYASMLRGGPHQLPYLGPSFFTKMLYALDTSDGRAVGRALILDHVLVGLRDLANRLPAAAGFATLPLAGPGRSRLTRRGWTSPHSPPSGPLSATNTRSAATPSSWRSGATAGASPASIEASVVPYCSASAQLLTLSLCQRQAYSPMLPGVATPPISHLRSSVVSPISFPELR